MMGVDEDLDDLYQNAPCGYVSLGPDGRIVKSNRTLSSWIGFTPEELMGKRLRDLLNVAGRIFYETHFAPLLRMQGFFNEVALDIVKSDGGRLAVLVNAMERRDVEGRVQFVRITIFRATERRKYERGLVEAKNSAERELMSEREASELREQFIAVLGHDLRNPLASVDAGARMLLRDGWTDRSEMILRLMRGSVTRMNGLVNNLMDLARARLGGGLSLDLAEGDIEATLVQVIEEIRVSHPDRRITASIRIAELFRIDHLRLAQMFSNLLGNALTHGAEDQPIRVDAAIEKGEFILAVANAGPGIPAHMTERLFQPFFRGDVRPSQQGLGLGLYISSEIAHAHHGIIEVSSDATETRFTFRMPILLRADRPTEPASSE